MQSAHIYLAIAGLWVVACAQSPETKGLASLSLKLLALGLHTYFCLRVVAPFLSSGYLAIPAVVAIASAFLLIWKVLLRVFCRITDNFPQALVTATVLGFLALSHFTPGLPLHLSVALKGVTWLSILSIWYLAVAAFEKRNSIFDGINPFWNPTPIPFSYDPPRDSEDRLQQMRSGLRLLAYVSVLKLPLLAIAHFEQPVLSSIAAFVFRSPAGPQKYYFDFYHANLSMLDRWEITIGGFLVHLLDLTWFTGLVVAAGRLAGFSIWRYVYRPFTARTFFEALTRSNYHYVQLITRLWMYPLLGSFSLIKNHGLRITFCAALSIFGFGCVYHFLRFPGFLLNSPDKWSLLWDFWRYYLLTAVIAAASLALTLKRPPAQDQAKLELVLRNVLYVLVYAVIFGLIGTDFFKVSGADHLGFVLKLFRP